MCVYVCVCVIANLLNPFLEYNIGLMCTDVKMYSFFFKLQVSMIKAFLSPVMFYVKWADRTEE